MTPTQANPRMFLVLLPLLAILMVPVQSQEQAPQEGAAESADGLVAESPTHKAGDNKMCLSCSSTDTIHDTVQNTSCTTPRKELSVKARKNGAVSSEFCPAVANICYVYVFQTTIERGCGEGTKDCSNYVGPLGQSHGRCPYAFPHPFSDVLPSAFSEFGEVVTWSDIIPNHCRYCTCDTEKDPGCNIFPVGNYTIPKYVVPMGDSGTMIGNTFFSLLIISLTALTVGSGVLQ